MDELEQIRQRKLEEMRRAQAEQADQQAQQKEVAEQQLSQLEYAVKQLLTSDAWEQWSAAKMANPENAYLAAAEIVRQAQMGKLQGKINREQVREILRAVGRQTRREFNIK